MYSNIGGVQRDLDLTNGQVTLAAGGKVYNITKPLIVADAGCDEQGTVWMRYKSGNIYWWNYDLQKDETVIAPKMYVSGIGSLEIEGDYVVGLKSNTGKIVNLLTLEEQKKVLGITSEPSQPTNPTQPDEKPSQPTNPTQPDEKPSQPTKPTQPSKPATKKKTTEKIGKVTHKGRTYYVYSTKGKVLTKFSLTKKGGKFTWRGYSMKNVIYVGIIRKSKNVVVLTKKAGYKFNFSTMKRSKLYDTKYGKPLKLEYDKDGCAVKVVTKKPYRFSIKNK